MIILDFKKEIGSQLNNVLTEVWQEIEAKKTTLNVEKESFTLSNNVEFSHERTYEKQNKNCILTHIINISMIKALVPIEIMIEIDLQNVDYRCRLLVITLKSFKKDIVLQINDIGNNGYIADAEARVIDFISKIFLSIDKSIKREYSCLLEEEIDNYFYHYYKNNKIYKLKETNRQRNMDSYELIISLVATLARNQNNNEPTPIEYCSDYNKKSRTTEVSGDSIFVTSKWIDNLKSIGSENYTDAIVMILKEDKDYDYTGLF